jgi:hypothetical protein
VRFRRTDILAAFWASGSVNVPGGPQTLDEGGVTIDNNETPGCEAPNINCYPLKWKTYPEFMEDANVTWQVVCYAPLPLFDVCRSYKVHSIKVSAI